MRTMHLVPLLVAVLAGCSELPTVRQGERNVLDTQQVALVRFDAYFPAYNSGFGEPVRRVVDDAAEWEDAWRELWRSHNPVPPAPAVDFSREVVLLAAMGTRSSGGYSIHVEDAAAKGDHVTVRVIETSPGRACGVTAALTEPVDIVKLSRTPLPIRWETVKSVHDCR
jgi:hypothetical protein